MDIDITEWEYLGSGAANVVFGYIGDDEKLFRKVIRLRIEGSMLATPEVYDYLTSPQFDELKPFFLNISVVQISLKTLLEFQKLISTMRTCQSKKLKLDEKYALIMDNFLSDRICHYEIIKLNKYYKFFIRKFSNDLIFEFKPKWLTEPPDSFISCRNCINAMSKNQKFLYCHLQIFNDGGIDSFSSTIANELQLRGVYIEDVQAMIKVAFEKNIVLLRTLRRLQSKINIHDVLSSLNSVDNVTDELLFNMTIRDVSLVFKLQSASVSIIDVDKKSPEKWKDWKLRELEYKHHYFSDSKLNCRVKTSS